MKEIMRYFKEHPYEIIKDIDGLLELLGIDVDKNIEIQIKNTILDHNIGLLNRELSTNKELHKKIDNIQMDDYKSEEKNIIESKREKVIKVEKTVLPDINHYLPKILKCNNIEEIDNIIPKEYTTNYYQIINSLLLNINVEININLKIINEVSDDEKEIIRNDINELRKTFDLLLQIKKETIVEEPEEKNINVVFINKNNSTTILDDIEHIDIEYYESIYKLLHRFIDGELMGINDNTKNKSITNNDKLAKVKELKNNSEKLRITYMHLSHNTYVILRAFIKKSNKTTLTMSYLESSYDLFHREEEELLELIKNPEFLLEQQSYLDDIDNVLSKRKGMSI